MKDFPEDHGPSFDDIAGCWGLSRLRAEVEYVRIAEQLASVRMTIALAARGMKRRKAGMVRTAAQETSEGVLKNLSAAAGNVEAIEASLDSAAAQYAFDAAAVRAIVGLPRFVPPADIIINTTVRALADELLRRVLPGLRGSEVDNAP